MNALTTNALNRLDSNFSGREFYLDWFLNNREALLKSGFQFKKNNLSMFLDANYRYTFSQKRHDYFLLSGLRYKW